MANSQKRGSGCAIAGAGCGIFILLALVMLAGLGYLGYKVFKGSYSGIQELTRFAQIENDVVNQTAYVPPADGMLSLEQVESLAYIQTQIKEAIGPEFAVLSEQHQQLISELEQMSDFAKLRKLLSLSSQLVKPLARAKEAQIEAINREGLSMSEYKWMRTQAMQALGIPEHKFDIHDILEHAEKGEEEKDPSTPRSEPVQNPLNRRLLEPHIVVLTETLMLSAIGL